MSKFLKVYVIAFTGLLLLALGNVIVDPYALHPLVKIDGVSWPKPEVVKSVKMHKSYKVAQFKPEVVVMGTSRSAFGIDPDYDAWGNDFKLRYNLSLSGANMYVTRRFLEHAEELHSLKQVMLGLDFFTFNVYRQQAPDYRGDFLIINDDGSSNRNFNMKILAASLLSTDALKASYNTIFSKKKYPLGISKNGMFTGPVGKNNLRKSFSYMEKLYLQHVYLVGRNREYAFINPDTGVSSLDEFRKIIIYCREHQIDLKLFISPPHARHQEIIRVLGLWPLFEQWKRELVQILQEENYGAPLWDFSGYNSMTTVDISTDGGSFYRDSTHYHPSIGNMILSRIFHYSEENVPADFGRVLNSDNMEDNLLSIRNEQEKYQVKYPMDVMDIELVAEEYNFNKEDLVLRIDGVRSKARWFESQSRGSEVRRNYQ